MRMPLSMRTNKFNKSVFLNNEPNESNEHMEHYFVCGNKISKPNNKPNDPEDNINPPTFC